MDTASRVRLALSGALAATCAGLVSAVPRLGPDQFLWYRSVVKGVVALQAAVAGVVPFALWDILAVAFVVAFVVALWRRLKARRPLAPLLTRALLCVSLALLLALGWAQNHYAPTLAEELGMDVGAYSTEELAQATAHYLECAATRAAEVPRDDEGGLAQQDFFAMARVAGASYEVLGQEHEVFEGTQAPVKALLVAGEPLLFSGHTGIWWPPTGEAGVPLNCARADLPFILCHEAAHRLAIASEQEANFAAFLACEASDDVRFQYAGYYDAFCYCVNALLGADPDAAQAMVEEVAAAVGEQDVALVLADRAATAAHYRAYKGPLEEVGRTVNDTYLRSFGESAGVRSYGLVVDYLIAHYERPVV